MLGPMNIYDTGPPLIGQFKQNATIYPLTNLLGTAIKIHMYQPQLRLHKLGKGAVTIVDPPNALFSYAWDSTDTSMAGLWQVWAELTVGTQVMSSINIESLQITNRVRGYSKLGMGRVRISIS